MSLYNLLDRNLPYNFIHDELAKYGKELLGSKSLFVPTLLIAWVDKKKSVKQIDKLRFFDNAKAQKADQG